MGGTPVLTFYCTILKGMLNVCNNKRRKKKYRTEEEVTLLCPEERPSYGRCASDDGQDVLAPSGVFGPLDGPTLDDRVLAKQHGLPLLFGVDNKCSLCIAEVFSLYSRAFPKHVCQTCKLRAVLTFTVTNFWVEVPVEAWVGICIGLKTPPCNFLFFGQRGVGCRVLPSFASALVEHVPVGAQAIAGVVGRM